MVVFAVFSALYQAAYQLKTTPRPRETNLHQQGLGLDALLGVVKNSRAPRNVKKS